MNIQNVKIYGIKLILKSFWFFENNFVYYGGISQWIQYNLESKDWYRNYSGNDFHPSKSGHKIWRGCNSTIGKSNI